MLKRSILSFILSSPLFGATQGNATWTSNPVKTAIQFATHIQAGFPELDVFVEQDNLPGNQVMRVEGKEAQDSSNLVKMLYATTKAVPHDPFKLGSNPLGPLPKGRALGFTLGQWLDARGSGSYTVNGDEAYCSLSFEKLVPNGLYTVWCTRLTFPPNLKIVETPCGANDGTQNAFRANADGKGNFELRMRTLPETTKETATLLVIYYHSDGRTHGSVPGDWGRNAHAQLFVIIPASTLGEITTAGGI